MEILLSSAEKASPQLHTILSKIKSQNPRQLQLFHPIQLNKFNGLKNYGIMSKSSNISKNDKIFQISTETCFTGMELLNSNRNTVNKLELIVEKIAKKYHEFNLPQYYYTINLLKVIFQLFVHGNDSSTSHHDYASFLYQRSPQLVPLKWNEEIISVTFSRHLINLIGNQRMYFLSLAKDFEDSQIPALKVNNITELANIVRARSLNFNPLNPKQFDRNNFIILSPLVDMMNHSFDPNACIEGYYNSMDCESFVVVKSLKEIKDDEEVTVNYGNYSNYEFLMKFGFMSHDNPFNEYHIKLDFSKYLDYSPQLFELKQKIYSLENDFSIDKIIIYSDRIDEKYLSYLRIYFLSEEDVQQNLEIHSYTVKDFKRKINNENEKAVFGFLIDHLKFELDDIKQFKNTKLKDCKSKMISELIVKDSKLFDNLDYFNQNKTIIEDYNVMHAIQIGLEEEYLLIRNLEFCKRQLQLIT